MPSTKDQLFNHPLSDIPPFEFNAQVANVFPDMIHRSVPGYRTVIAQLSVIAAYYAQPHSRYYDLGCSLGAATCAMAQAIKQPNCEFIAVDQSQAMLEKCRQQLNALEFSHPIELVCADIADVVIADASIVVLNFTLQFIPQEKRDALIQKIYQGLNPGGILILSEKIIFNNAYQENALNELHLAFKRAQGYSELEISQKRSALEKILNPETLEQHQQRLTQEGFRQVLPWFQCFNFASLIAQK